MKGVTSMLAGKFTHNIDSKGRVFVPVRFRSELQGELIIVEGPRGNLVLFANKEWHDFQKKFEVFGEEIARNIKAALNETACTTELDAQGRISINSELREIAGLSKETDFLGLDDRVEIWQPDRFEESKKETDKKKLMESLKNVGF